jgi:hypothetical protein
MENLFASPVLIDENIFIREKITSDIWNCYRDFILNLAYIKIDNIFTPGLNLTIGRQNLKIGEGFVIGSQYNALNASKELGPLLGSTLGIQKSFDAIKVNYTPQTISKLSAQGFFAKVNENSTTSSINDNDVDLYGLSVLYNSSIW